MHSVATAQANQLEDGQFSFHSRLHHFVPSSLILIDLAAQNH